MKSDDRTFTALAFCWLFGAAALAAGEQATKAVDQQRFFAWLAISLAALVMGAGIGLMALRKVGE